MNVEFEFPGLEELEKIKDYLKGKGTPTENRLLIISNTGAVKTWSGIILPSQAKEGVPKKGMVVQLGPIGEGYDNYKFLEMGHIVTYGLYAGKEITFPELDIDYTKFTFSVLSLNEILYVESNNLK